ncbi:MAG TPA: hypothetical protein V6C78_32245 [Crinalium sp.]
MKSAPDVKQPRFNLDGQSVHDGAPQARRRPPQPTPTQPAPTRRRRPMKKTRYRQRWKWSLVFLATLGVFGTVGLGAFLWLATLPPLPNCQSISPLSADMERLYCARAAIQSGKVPDLVAGIELVKGWTDDRPLYKEAEQLLADCSTALMTIARSKVEHNELDEAVKIASSIPSSSPLYAKAQEAIAHWKSEWQQGTAIYAAAQAALKAQNWNEAAAQVPALGQLDNLYWRRDRASDLTQEILAERSSRETLTQAQKLAKSGDLDKVGQAIAFITDVDPETYAWQEATVELKTWSQSLLTVAMQNWWQGNLDGALALAQYIPPDLELDSTERDLVQFSHAQKLIDQHANQMGPSLQQIWGLREAVAAAQQIKPESPLYPLVHRKIKDWQAQIQDLTQLQFANFTASLGQRAAYEVAIAQAATIAPNSTKRLQAQTLIAHWHQQIERIQDQPYLLSARKLAEPGTIPALKAAIALAQQIPLGRALRIDAQTAIAEWTDQIETIEDKPMLDKAMALAEKGNLSDAIQEAKKIRSGRALYDKAQAAIADWRAQIRAAQIAEDRKILDKAGSLAAVQSLTLAIETASQIGPGRPLYDEAQSAIAEWRSQRAAIWETWSEQDQQSGDDSSSDDYSSGDSSSDESYDAPQ